MAKQLLVEAKCQTINNKNERLYISWGMWQTYHLKVTYLLPYPQERFISIKYINNSKNSVCSSLFKVVTEITHLVTILYLKLFYNINWDEQQKGPKWQDDGPPVQPTYKRRGSRDSWARVEQQPIRQQNDAELGRRCTEVGTRQHDGLYFAPPKACVTAAVMVYE